MFTVLIAELLYGMNLGWVAPILKRSENPEYDVTLTSEQRSWVASIQDPFKICGMLLCAAYIDLMGRKTMLLGATLLHLIGWALIRFTKSVCLIYVFRSILGIMFGFLDMTVIICLGENSSPKTRGVYTSLCEIAFFGGLIIQYILASYLKYDTVAIVNFAMGLLHLTTIFLMKETVQYLVIRKRYEHAECNYRWLFSQDKTEFEKLKSRITSSTKESLNFKVFFNTPSFYKSISIGIMLSLLLYATGFWTLIAYSSIAFSSSDILTPNEFTISNGLLMLLASLGSSFFIERYNRRTILLIALAVSICINAITATLYYVQENINTIPNFPWLVFVSITLFMVVYSMGIMTINNVLRSELFPQKVKPLGVGLSSLAGSLGIFSSSIRFLQIAETYGIFVDFLLFSMMGTLSFVFIYFFVPETRGKSLLEIEQCFTKSTSKDFSHL